MRCKKLCSLHASATGCTDNPEVASPGIGDVGVNVVDPIRHATQRHMQPAFDPRFEPLIVLADIKQRCAVGKGRLKLFDGMF